jgi:hypothetical protein
LHTAWIALYSLYFAAILKNLSAYFEFQEMGFCFWSFSKYLLLVVQGFFSCALSLSLTDSGDEIANFCSDF